MTTAAVIRYSWAGSVGCRWHDCGPLHAAEPVPASPQRFIATVDKARPDMPADTSKHDIGGHYNSKTVYGQNVASHNLLCRIQAL
jgi:hypothetical protein